jgi:hypothetical protein
MCKWSDKTRRWIRTGPGFAPLVQAPSVDVFLTQQGKWRPFVRCRDRFLAVVWQMGYEISVWFDGHCDFILIGQWVRRHATNCET